MARLARDYRLETREARARLPIPTDREPYWKQLTPGIFVGYRKGPTGGVWLARVAAKTVGRDTGAAYLKKNLGTADDTADSNGADILSYKEAFTAALAFAEDSKTHDKPTAKYTVADCVKDYLAEHYAKEGRAHYRTENTFTVHILPVLGKRVVAELTAKELNKWLMNLTTAPLIRRGKAAAVDQQDPEAIRKRKATANRILNVLKAALNHSFRAGRVPSDTAWRRVAPFKRADSPKIRYLTQDESRRLINATAADFRPMVRAALMSGCRYGELCKLKVADCDLDNGSIYIAAPKAKPRHVPLTDEGRRWFAEWTAGKSGADPVFTRPDGTPWARDHQARRMKEANAAAGINPPVDFHTLRHSYGSALATAGVPLQMIADALGHADTRMTSRHYAHLQPSAVADMIRAHLPALGGPETNVTPLRRAAG